MKRFRSGQMMVLFGLVLVALVGAMGLGGDVAVLYFKHQQAQKAADGGALAGATHLGPWNSTTTPPLADPTATTGCPSSPKADAAACNYAVSNYALATEVGTSNPNAQQMRVVITRTVPTYFLSVLGLTSLNGSASATASAALPATSAKGLFPVGMSPLPQNAAMQYGHTYTLTGDKAPGNWGFLDIPQNCSGASCNVGGSGGAPNLAQNIQYGCACSLSVGDSLGSKPGLSWGQVNPAMAAIVTHPGMTVPAQPEGRSQLVLVPIVNWTGSGQTTVTILGFAEMWIVDYAKNGSTVDITAQFIKYWDAHVTGGTSGQTNYGSMIPVHLVN
jgi:putative Flp pilus-assembly TadE/G-like protein